MPYSNKYKLEAPCHKNDALFIFLESLSIVLKAAAIMLLILLINYFYVAIIVWILSIIPTFFRKNLLFKYVYTVDGNKLIVQKEYDKERSVVMEEVVIGGNTPIDETGEGTRYYETETERVLTVEKVDGSRFSIAIDDYFYALIDYARKQR